MMVVKQKHFSFPVHVLDTVQLYPAPHRNFIESAVADGLHTATCASPSGRGRQDAKVTQRSPGPETLPCMSLQIDMLSNKLGIFQFFLHISQMWETLGDHEFLVLQCPPTKCVYTCILDIVCF